MTQIDQAWRWQFGVMGDSGEVRSRHETLHGFTCHDGFLNAAVSASLGADGLESLAEWAGRVESFREDR